MVSTLLRRVDKPVLGWDADVRGELARSGFSHFRGARGRPDGQWSANAG